VFDCLNAGSRFLDAILEKAAEGDGLERVAD